MTLSQKEPKPPRKRQAEPQLDRLREPPVLAVATQRAACTCGWWAVGTNRLVKEAAESHEHYDRTALLSERQADQDRIAELERGIRILQDNWPKTIPAPMDSLLSSSGGDKDEDDESPSLPMGTVATRAGGAP